VRAIYNTALKEYDLRANPTVAVHWNKEERRQEPIAWTDLPAWRTAIGELSAVRRDYQLVVLLTGLRQMDAATIRWKHVDFEARTLHRPNPRAGTLRDPKPIEALQVARDPFGREILRVHVRHHGSGDERRADGRCMCRRSAGLQRAHRDKYGRQRWSLCKTTFNIVVERTAKFARERGSPLRVYVEKSDRETDKRLRGYYDELRAAGHKTKDKTSPPMQVADLCLWPLCIGGYDAANKADAALKAAGTLIDCKIPLDEVAARGIKYSCWELQTPA
jgi:hypothetical protein